MSGVIENRDVVYVRPYVSSGFHEEEPNRAAIQVYPNGGDAQMPSLPFLHKGDIFCDAEGNEWRITKAVQHMTAHRYADEDGGFPETFHWEYRAVRNEDD